MMVVMATTAMAQTVVRAINPAKYYTLSCKATDHGTFINDNGTVINGRSLTATCFQFEVADGVENGYYIKSVVSGKYLNSNGSNVTAADTKTAWILGIPDHTADAVYFGVNGTAGVFLNNNGTSSDGTCEGLKIASHGTSGPAATNACSLWTLTEYDEIPYTQVAITALSQLSNSKVYTFKSGRGAHYLLYHTVAPDNLSSTYGSGHPMDYSSTTENFQFAVYKFQDNYYMFNIAAKKFIGNNDNNNGAIPLVEMPTNDIEFRASQNAIHNFVISTNGTGALNCAATGGCHGVVNWNGGYNDLTDPGNVYLIIEVGDLSAELTAVIEERLNVGVTLAEAQSIIDGASDTRVGAYTTATVAGLQNALNTYNASQTAQNLEAIKTAINTVKTSGEKVTLSANEIFTVKCVEDTRGYMVYSTVEGKGSDTQVYLAETPYIDANQVKYHPGIADEGVYKEWAMAVRNGKKYIYNVEKKQFISADGVVQFTNSPTALNIIEIENNLCEIQFESNNKYLSFSPGWGADCVRTEYGVDNGCKFYLDKTGETVNADAIATVETIIINDWKEAALATIGYVGGYPSTLEASINAVNTLAGTTEFENANATSKIQFAPGYYFVKQVSTGKYASYNANGKFATEDVEKLGIKHVLQFVQDGENIKLQVPNLGKNVQLEDASANGSGASSIVDGGSNFAVVINNSANVIIKGDGQPMRTEGSGAINYWSGETNATWNIIPANDIEISVNEFASLYLPFAVSVEGATAYAVESTNDTYVTLTEKSDIPANKGAILATDGEATVTLNILAEAESDWTNNKLQGSTIDSYVAGAAYVLANGNNGIGLYKTILNVDGTGATGETHFKNNANKAYLPAVAGASNVACYSFRFGEGTTGIENVKGENGNAKAIFDLTGRKVNSITAPGIYIVGGRKVLVK